MVGLRTLNPPIQVRILAREPNLVARRARGKAWRGATGALSPSASGTPDHRHAGIAHRPGGVVILVRTGISGRHSGIPVKRDLCVTSAHAIPNTHMSFVCCKCPTNRPICGAGGRGASTVIGRTGLLAWSCRVGVRHPSRQSDTPNRYRGRGPAFASGEADNAMIRIRSTRW